MLFWSAIAFALPPDKQVALLEVGDAQIERFVVSPDGRFIAGRDAKANGNNAWVLDLDTWQYVTTEPCQVTGVAVRPITDVISHLWMSCEDGTLRVKEWEDGVLYDVVDADDNEFTVTLDDAALDGVWYAPATDHLYGLSLGDDRQLHVYNPADDLIDTDGGYPVAISTIEGYGQFDEGFLSGNGAQLLVSHGEDRVTAITLSGGASLIDTGFFSISPADITPSVNGGFYAVDADGQLAEFFTQGNNWVYLNGIDVTDLDPLAVVANTDPDDQWMVVFGSRVRIYEMKSGAFTSTSPSWESPDLDNNVEDGLAYDGYVFGGGIGGNLRVITARPWVDPATIAVDPTTAATGESTTLTFTIDEDADWTLYRGGDRTGAGGTKLQSGSATAGEVVSISLTVQGNGWKEGVNDLFVLATDATGEVGHGWVGLTVDNPPPAPTLYEDAAGFGDRRLVLTFDGISDEDLDHYTVYVSDTSFDAADYPTGGPTMRYQGTSYPIEVAAAPGATVEQEIRPLENDKPYWIAVRSVDAGGMESEMSRVVIGTPHAGLGAAELAGEQGGAPCDTGRGVPSGALITAAALAAWRRRGRAALVAAAVAAPTIASAADSAPPPFWKQHDLGAQHGDLEIRYGSVRFEDADFDQIYDDSNPRTLEVQFGPQFWRVLELDVGLGLIQKKTTTEYQGQDSTENVLFTAIPLTMDGTFRLQLIDEQIFVPYGRAGLDYFVWNERSSYDDLNPIFGIPEVPTTTTTGTSSGTSSATVEKISGAKMGVHWGFGGGLLLDVFAPNRASLLEAQTGVNDTYLTFDWRRQTIDDRSVWWETGTSDGLIFNGTAFTVGLKLDY